MALAAGRLTREDSALEEGLESMSFELTDLEEVLAHLLALEKAAGEDVTQARKHLADAERRQEETLARTEMLRRRFSADRSAFQDAMGRAGLGHHIRPEARAACDGALGALAKRRKV